MNDSKGTDGVGITANATRALRSMMPHGVALLCALASAGCLAQDVDGEDEGVGEAQQAALTNNALTNNALTNNALTNNALTNNALTNNALTNNALNTTPSLQAALSDPNARDVLKYIVSCAFPKGGQVNFTVDSVSYAFDGELGLAPQWAMPAGKCDLMCQQWVSACVLARVDYLGVKVQISMRGRTPALDASPAEKASYTVREGTYYGNIFLPTPERHACVAPGRTGLPRVCGPSTTGCAVDIVGYCSDVCDKADKNEGYYPNCRDKGLEANNHFPPGTNIYGPTASIFLTP